MPSIKTFKPIKYKNCPIYVRQFEMGKGDTFEYLTVIDGQIFSYPFQFKQQFFKRLLGIPYSEKELAKAVDFMQRSAQATIDEVTSSQPVSINLKDLQ